MAGKTGESGASESMLVEIVSRSVSRKKPGILQHQPLRDPQHA